MKELLIQYSLEEILLFIVLLAAAIKGTFTWIDWVKMKWKEKYSEKKHEEDLEASIKALIQSQKEMEIKVSTCQADVQKNIQHLAQAVDLLMESDRDDIKAWITQQHHHFCYEVGYIDDYNLDCIEKRFGHYEQEGGNSFIHKLMEEIRSLPKHGVLEKEEENK